MFIFLYQPQQIFKVSRPSDEKSFQSSLQTALPLQRNHDEVRGGQETIPEEGKAAPGQLR